MAKACATLAMVLGLAWSVTAQTPRSTWQRWPGSTPMPRPVSPPKVVVAQDARLAEILVELELMADPATFPYLLEAHAEASNSMLHLCGSVPGKAAREHALLVARQRWPSIVDDLSSQAAPAASAASIPPGRLQEAVLASLQTSFPQPGHFFEVQCDSHGRTRVQGFVHSFEDKLALSRQLRSVPGCACVINLAHVSAAVKERAPSAPASSAVKPPASWSRPGPAPASAARSTGNPGPLQVTGGESAIPVIEKKAAQKPSARTQLVEQTLHWKAAAEQTMPPPPIAEPKWQPSSQIAEAKRQPPPQIAEAKRQPPRPIAEPKRQPALRGEPYVAHGVVLVKEDALPARRALTGREAVQLKERVARTCRLSPRDIELVFNSPKDLEIVLTVPRSVQPDQYIERLVLVPELTAYHVSIRVRSPQ
jgi:hypothetical protein